MRLFLGILLFVTFLLPGTSFADPAKQLTMTKLFGQLRILCETEDAKERSEREAALHAGSERGRAALNRAAAKIEEMTSHKKRLERMVDRFITERQLMWHETKDVAARLKLEDDILAAQKLLNGGCDA